MKIKTIRVNGESEQIHISDFKGEIYFEGVRLVPEVIESLKVEEKRDINLEIKQVRPVYYSQGSYLDLRLIVPGSTAMPRQKFMPGELINIVKVK